MRFADTQTGHLAPMIKPNNSDAFDFDGELALIIGKTARHVSEADALDHIAGYACYNDGSVRDFQNHTPQWMPSKNFPATGAFGPWMVTTDEIPDPTRLTLTTRLNGEVVQQSATDLLIFTIPVLMAYITSFTTLRPGDVISTGTPGGVGFRRSPPLFMKAGDTIEVEITDVGTLTNPIGAEFTRPCGIFGRVGIGADIELAKFVGPLHKDTEVTAEFGFLGALAGAVVSCFVWPVMVTWCIWTSWKGRS